MQDVIEMLFRERDYWASIQEGVFILASVTDVFIPNPSTVPQDFVEFVRSTNSDWDRGKSVNGRAMFAEEINLANNNFKDKFGKWDKLTGYEPDRSYIHFLNRPTIMVYDVANGINLIQDHSEPIYSKGQINRRVESLDGTFPKCHSLVIPREGGGFFTAMIPGYALKIAVETESNILVGKGITMIANNNFTIISGNISNIKDAPKITYSCGNKTSLCSDKVSWMTEDECLEKIFTCESAFNLAKQPSHGSSLHQMTRYWSGKSSHFGIEGLLWKGWEEQKILELINQYKDEKSVEFAYYKLGELVQNLEPEESLTGFERRKFIEGCREIEQIFIALNHKGHPINQEVEEALSALANRKQQLVRGNNGFY